MMEPPPSQSNMSVSQPSIFVNRDGTPIQIFSEACSIRGRPKLMRTLRNCGAVLSLDPKSAQIILVDQETSDGKKFIRNWGQDKIILHYAWVKKSIQEGRALLKDCNWGEYLTVDDGLPIETEDTDEPEPKLEKSPLPTPRVTPVESKTKHPPRASRLSNPILEVPIKQDLMAQTLGTNDIAPTVTTPDLSQTMPVISSMPNNAPESFPQTSYTMQMPNMTSMPPQMNPMMMAQMTQYMMMMNSSNYPYNPQAQPSDFGSALMDALRMHNGQWPNSQLPQESPLQSNMYDRQTASRSSTQPNYPYPNISSNLFPGSNSQSTSMETPVRKKRRASSASSDSISMQDVLKSQIKSESTPPVTKRPKAGPSATQSSEKKLFHFKSGKEMSFFVQVEMHNRSAVVTSIKKHGGKIEGNNEIADYAILASGASKTKTFKDLLLSTVAAGRPALSARFVHESVAQNTLLDPRDFAFESPPIKSRKRTHDGESSDEHERRRLAKNERTRARRQRLREEAAQLSSQPQKKESISKNNSTALHAHSGPRSPTPPPEHTREAVGNYFKFTDLERTYAIKYVQVLLERDHEISSHAIGAALHNKLPHHSVGSWRTHLGMTVVRGEIDRLRKRAGIVFRKAQEQQSQASQSAPEFRQQDKFESELEDPAVTRDTSSPTLVGESETDKKMAEEEDFNVIATFFAGNADENENESVVWERLTSQATCKTASSWEEFYNTHHEEVVKRYEKLLE